MINPTELLDDVKLHCRVDNDQEDSLLLIYIAAALEACQMHTGKRFDNGLEFTPAIKAGCLMYTGMLYENRETVSDLNLKEVPFAVSSLWSVYRDVGVY